MTFLELCQRVAERCDVSGTITTVTGQSGEYKRIVNWTAEAWMDIQRAQSDWDWMTGEFSFQTVAADREYTAVDAGATNFSKWLLDTFRIYLTSTGVSDEGFLVPTDYREFRNTYMFGSQADGRPSTFTVRPRNSNLLLGLRPDAIYTVEGEYRKAATQMTVDADEPGMPSEYHMLVVHGARKKYGFFESASEVLAEATKDYDRLLGELARLHTEAVSLGEPLA